MLNIIQTFYGGQEDGITTWSICSETTSDQKMLNKINKLNSDK